MGKRKAPYQHPDGTDCYTKNCGKREVSQFAGITKDKLEKALANVTSDGPIIGLDLDGVTSQYEAGLKEFIKNKKNLTDDDFPIVTDYAMHKSGWPIKDREEFIALHAEAVEEGLFETLKAMPGAVETLNRLVDDGYSVRVITSRFIKGGQHAKVVSQTTQNLDNIGVPYKDIAFTASKTDVYADVYVDDAPENIRSFIEHDKNFVVYGHEYNKEFQENRAVNWNEVESLIRKLAPLPHKK